MNQLLICVVTTLLSCIIFSNKEVAGVQVSSDVWVHPLRPTLVPTLGDSLNHTCLDGQSVKNTATLTAWAPVVTASTTVTVHVVTYGAATVPDVEGPACDQISAGLANTSVQVFSKISDSATEPACAHCGVYGRCEAQVAAASFTAWTCDQCPAAGCYQVKVVLSAAEAGAPSYLCDISVLV